MSVNARTFRFLISGIENETTAETNPRREWSTTMEPEELEVQDTVAPETEPVELVAEPTDAGSSDDAVDEDQEATAEGFSGDSQDEDERSDAEEQAEKRPAIFISY